MTGSTSKKDAKYRKNLFAKVEGDTTHPINNGIHMQAHHLISEEGLKMSQMGNLLKMRGYDINAIKNLVFLPSTLPGACHLGVQPHRGNHIFKDDEHPKSYHQEVGTRLTDMQEEVDNCSASDSAKKTQKLINATSKVLLGKIKSFSLPLTPIMTKFDTDKQIGCGNCIDVKEHQADSTPCKSNRDHYQQAHPMYKSGKEMKEITIPKIQYALKVGK